MAKRYETKYYKYSGKFTKKIDNIQLLHECKSIRDNQMKQKIQSDSETLTNEDKIERIRLQNEITNSIEEYDDIFIDYLNNNATIEDTCNKKNKLTQYILDANAAAAKMLKFKLSESNLTTLCKLHIYHQTS